MSSREQSVARAVAQFALTGLAGVLLLGLVAVQLLRSTGTREAIDDAKRVSRLAADAVVVPRMTPALMRGDPKAIGQLDRVVRAHLLGHPIVRVKVWDAAGKIVYSDEHRLIGSRYPLGADERKVLRNWGLDADVSDLSEPENRFERRYKKLLEVYRGVRGPSGEPLLFESYQPFSSIAASASDTWQRFLPALIGAMVLLELLQIPLAYLLARRLRERQRERGALLQRALDASEAERRRIARDLHDGPVQDLAGVAFGLAAASERLNGAETDIRRPVEDAARRARETMRELRTTLVDLYPATLQRSGLQAPIDDLLGRLKAEGIDTRCDIPADLVLPGTTEALLFRVAREALANVRKHADPARVAVRIWQEGDQAIITVDDDGHGFDAAQVLTRDG